MRITLSAALIGLAACAQPGADGRPDSSQPLRSEGQDMLPVPPGEAGNHGQGITGPPWQVTQIGGRAVSASQGMTVRFDADGSISGYGGCNRYHGSYRIDGAEIATGPIAATRRACLDPASNQLESDFLVALGALRTFQVQDDGSLRLIAENGTEITARR